MDGVDKERVQKVVYEMSKGSKYFENEKRKEAFIQQKIENLRSQRDKLTDKDIAHFQEVGVLEIGLLSSNFFLLLSRVNYIQTLKYGDADV